MIRIQEKESKKRLPAGTLVIGTCQFTGESPEVCDIHSTKGTMQWAVVNFQTAKDLVPGTSELNLIVISY